MERTATKELKKIIKEPKLNFEDAILEEVKEVKQVTFNRFVDYYTYPENYQWEQMEDTQSRSRSPSKDDWGLNKELLREMGFDKI